MPFALGANLPWIRYGTDFGGNAWHPDGGIGAHPDPSRVRDLFAALRGHDLDVLRWFVLCDGRAGIAFDSDGTPVGVSDLFWRDFDAALQLLTGAGLRLMPVLLDFHWARPVRRVNGVQLGGRAVIISDLRRRAALVERVIAPIAARYGREPAIYAWDLFNEPEWITFGVAAWRPLGSVTPGSLRRFLRDAASAVHASATQPVTVGSASARWLPLVTGLDLDMYQVHWYDRLEGKAPLARPVSALCCDRPVLLGEFPTAGSARAPAEILRIAKDAGYAGALFWSVLAEDTATYRPV